MIRHFAQFCVAILVLLVVTTTVSQSVQAANRARLNITTSEQDDYIRLILHSSSSRRFSPYIKNSQLIIPLEHAVWANLSSITAKLAQHITAADLSNDGKTLSFTLKHPADFRIRPFIGEKFVGLDLMKLEPSIETPSNTQLADGQLVFEKASIQQATVTQEIEPFELAQQDASIVAIDSALKATQTTVEVSSSDENRADTTTKAETSTASPVTIESTDATANETAADKTQNTSLPAEETDTTEENNTASNSPIATNTNTATEREEITIPNYYEITFEWSKPVASAIFKRGGYAWFIFNEYQPIDMDEFLSQHYRVFESGEQINNRKHTILRMKHRYPFSLAGSKQDQSWKVTFATRTNPPAQPLPVRLKESKLHGSVIEIQSTQFSEPIRLFDPHIGDEMMIVPSYETEAGVGLAREQIDYRLLKTAQGVALILKSDNVQVTQKQFALAISGPTNRITSNESKVMREKLEELKRQREEARKEKLAQEGESSLVKFHSWKGEDEFIKERQRFEKEITLANWENKNPHRLNLARFFLAHGMEVESLGVIETIKSYDPTYGNRKDVLLVEGVANYLAERYKPAFDTLSKIKITDNKALELENAEIKFWKAAAEIKLNSTIKMDKFVAKHPLASAEKEGEQSEDKVEITKLILDTSSRLLKMIKKIDPKLATSEEIQTLESTARFVSSHYQDVIKRFGESDVYRSSDAFEAEDESQWWNTSGIRPGKITAKLDYLPNRLLFLKDYPTEIFNHFALLALEERLENNDINSAERILETFRDSDDTFFRNSLAYLRGLFYAKDEEIDLALKAWKPLEEEIFDRYNRARSQFASVGLELKTGRINLDQAIERFNDIRIIWRGDVLELNLLKLLGEFYMDQRQYMQAFKTWREVLTNFPGSEDALLIAKKMNQEFVYLFNSGGASQLSQIEALTLYYEFRELTPVGKQGDQMILKLVDRLVDIDLLGRASALLTHLVRFRLIGEEKHLASTRLAEIYLMSNEYKKTLDALNATKSEQIDPELQTRRRYIKAKAFINLKQNNQALALLRDDESMESAFLRAEIYWRNKVWRKVVDELEYPFKEIIREERDLTQSEREALNKIAISYALMGNTKRLKLLEEDFSPYVPEAQKQLLAFISNDDNSINYRNLEGSLGLEKMEDFIQNYMNVADGQNREAPAN